MTVNRHIYVVDQRNNLLIKLFPFVSQQLQITCSICFLLTHADGQIIIVCLAYDGCNNLTNKLCNARSVYCHVYITMYVYKVKNDEV